VLVEGADLTDQAADAVGDATLELILDAVAGEPVANLGVVSCRRADHTQFSSSHLRRRHTNGETDADLGRAEKFALFPRFSDTSPVRVISDWAERRKVAGPPARTPSVRLRFHKQLFHSFHNEVGNDIWT